MKNIALLLTSTLLVLHSHVFAVDTPSPATPPQTAPRGHNMLEKFDLNQDGKISREEFATKRMKGFIRFDTDQTGSLSLEEFTAHCQNERCKRMKTKQFTKLDKDGDNNVTKDEFVGVSKLFDKADRNKDGYLSEDELPNKQAKRADRQAPQAAPPPPTTDEAMKTPAK